MTFEFMQDLDAEYRAYAEKHGLKAMSADELYHELLNGTEADENGEHLLYLQEFLRRYECSWSKRNLTFQQMIEVEGAHPGTKFVINHGDPKKPLFIYYEFDSETGLMRARLVSTRAEIYPQLYLGDITDGSWMIYEEKIDG